MRKKLPAFLCALAILPVSGAFADDAVAQAVIEASFVEDIGASERINYSGKLRMLSQRIPAAACYTHAGIEREASRDLLAAATAEFDLILSGLEFGEEKLGIKGAETDRAALLDIQKVHEFWDPLHTEIDHIIANGGTDEEIFHLSQQSAPMLKHAKHLVSVLVGEYADPTALLQTDAMTIDIAGRQRMLAQRISKNACLITTGFESEDAHKELASARQIYDASANALRFGMPDAGIKATTNAEILTGLDEVLGLWAEVQPILDKIDAGDDLSRDEQSFIYNTMNSLTGQMNRLVGLYNDASKLGL